MTLEEVIKKSSNPPKEGWTQIGQFEHQVVQAIRKWLIRTGILYKNNGRYYIGMHGDADVTDEIMGTQSLGDDDGHHSLPQKEA